MQIDDNPLGGVTYARFFPSDWRAGCFCLNLEEEGLYIRCCAWMYDTGQPIPGNDVSAAKLLHVQTQKYSKVMQSLIDKGKMTRAQGVIVNTRVLAEIDKYRAQRAGRSMAAKKREEEKTWRLERELTNALSPKNAARGPELALTTPPPTPPPTPQATPPRLPTPTPPTSTEGAHPGCSKNINEINGSSAETWQSSTTPWADAGNPESRSHKEVQRSTINQSNIHGVHASEGSIDPKVATAIGLLAVLFGSESDPDHDKAYAIGMKWAKAYPAVDVLDGVMDLDTRRRDRSESRQVSEHLVGQYVRQAEKSRLGQPSTTIVAGDKPAAQAIPVGRVAEGIEIDPGNRIVMSNGVRSEWLEKFGGDEKSLSLALTEIEGRLNRGLTPIETQIRSGLAAIARGENLYAKTAKQNAAIKGARYAQPTTSGSGAPAETRAQRYARLVTEFE